VVTVITAAQRVVRALAGASNASPTLSLPPLLADAECLDVAMADAECADVAMADVPLSLAETVEGLPTPGGMSSPSVFGSPPPVGSGTGLAMPADEGLQQQKVRLVRAATSAISTVRAQSASAKTQTVLLPRMPLSLTCCDASAWSMCRSLHVM
jgi:hypothetical protein